MPREDSNEDRARQLVQRGSALREQAAQRGELGASEPEIVRTLDQAIAFLNEAVRLLHSHPTSALAQAHQECGNAMCLKAIFNGGLEDGIAEYQVAADLYEQLGDFRSMGKTLFNMAYMCAKVGRFTEGHKYVIAALFSLRKSSVVADETVQSAGVLLYEIEQHLRKKGGELPPRLYTPTEKRWWQFWR